VRDGGWNDEMNRWDKERVLRVDWMRGLTIPIKCGEHSRTVVFDMFTCRILKRDVNGVREQISGRRISSSGDQKKKDQGDPWGKIKKSTQKLSVMKSRKLHFDKP
jgi:hypothetical protein